MSSWRKGVLAFLRWVDLSSGGHIAKAVGRCADTPGISPPFLVTHCLLRRVSISIVYISAVPFSLADLLASQEYAAA